GVLAAEDGLAVDIEVGQSLGRAVEPGTADAVFEQIESVGDRRQIDRAIRQREDCTCHKDMVSQGLSPEKRDIESTIRALGTPGGGFRTGSRQRVAPPAPR